MFFYLLWNNLYICVHSNLIYGVAFKISWKESVFYSSNSLETFAPRLLLKKQTGLAKNVKIYRSFVLITIYAKRFIHLIWKLIWQIPVISKLAASFFRATVIYDICQLCLALWNHSDIAEIWNLALSSYTV